MFLSGELWYMVCLVLIALTTLKLKVTPKSQAVSVVSLNPENKLNAHTTSSSHLLQLASKLAEEPPYLLYGRYIQRITLAN
jgi:hypothetical protein